MCVCARVRAYACVLSLHVVTVLSIKFNNFYVFGKNKSLSEADLLHSVDKQ